MKFKNYHIMKQPELGQKILELRKQKGFTQEELVAQCNINVRTIQRIESGEVNPRSYTVKIILEVLGEDLNLIKVHPITENIESDWTKNELKMLNNSWIFGIFLTIISLISVLVLIYFTANKVNNIGVLTFKIVSSILFFILIIPFLNGYKVLAKKFNNILLVNAVYIYFGVSVLMTIIMFFTKSSGFISALEIVFSVTSMVVLGTGELIMGLGILKLKENVGSLAQITGTIKIVNGIMLITVILSPIAMFFMIAILILEVVFLHNTFKMVDDSITHDDKVHS
jgi:transcriptional regulator with XRE-family HTH domain